MVVTVLSKPVIVQQPESQTAVEGDAVTFSVTAVGTPPLSYRWRRNGAAITPYRIGGSTLTLTNVQLSNAGSYSVIITNSLSTGVLSSSAVLTVLADSDGDHIPDVWETAYGLNPNDASDAAQDTDNDGQTNQQEFLAGTDPTDPTSHLQFDSITFDAASDRIWLRLFAASNRTYTVQSSALVDGGIWTRLADVPALATNRFIEVSDSVEQPASKRRFYRLVAPRVP